MCSRETTRGFLKIEKENYIFIPSSFHIKNEFSAYDELE